MRARIGEDKLLNSSKIISILSQTKILKGTDSVIGFQEEL